MDTSVKVLIVDDYPTMRKLMKATLAQLGFENVEEAENGAEALSRLQDGASEYGLIISDWNMPELSGIDLLRAVRKEPSLKKLPFMMVTTNNQHERITEAAESGVNQFVAKPFSQEGLEEKLRAVLC